MFFIVIAVYVILLNYYKNLEKGEVTQNKIIYKEIF